MMAVTEAEAMEAMPGGIEGLERLKIPQSSFTLNRRARPPPIELPVVNERLQPSVKQPHNLQRQTSKGGIRNIFNRHKAEKGTVGTLTEEREPQSAVSTIYGDHAGPQLSTKQTTSSLPTTSAKSIVKPSRLNLRGKSTKDTKPSPRSSAKPSPGRPTRSSAAWDPPPLFQAYPQAIKHAQLAASTLSADSIIRIGNHKRSTSITEYNPTTPSDQKEQAAAAKKTEKAKSKHRRQISGSISKADWTQKIFVLVTSGYLLQYAGEGSFDRLPEKMMQLGKDSVAFASDVIPGKHWVLQISQSMDADGTPTSDSRSLLSRLTFRGGADYRRTATSLLLVLDNAEDMDSWLAVVRREIESLGGKKYVPDIIRQKSEEKVLQLEKRPSHRYLIQRNPEEFSKINSPTTPHFEANPWSRSNSLQGHATDVVSTADWNQLSARPSTSHQSVTNSFVSHDGRQLDELRNSNRFSYVSSGQRTAASAQFSSPESSPTRDSSLSTFDDITPKVSIEDARPRPNALAVNERRRSMQTMPLALADQQQTSKMQRHSTYGSSVTPNFSLPNSSSRRYSTNRSSNSLSHSSITSMRSEPVLKGVRKAPPPAITVARPLSPVADDPSPMQDVKVLTPVEPSFNSLQQITASVIDIAPRSPLPSPAQIDSTSSQHTQPQRPTKSNSLSLPSKEELRTQRDFRFPKRPTSMIAISDNIQSIPDRKKRTSFIADTASPTRSPSMAKLVQQPPTTLKKEDYASSLVEKQTLPALPVLANTKTKVLRRPTSMQIRQSAFTPFGAPSSLTTSPTGSSFSIRNARVLIQQTTSVKPSQLSTSSSTALVEKNEPASKFISKNFELKQKIPTGVQRLKVEEKRSLVNRRSLPFLVGGPPPAPPPDCALPPLPPVAGKRAIVR